MPKYDELGNLIVEPTNETPPAVDPPATPPTPPTPPEKTFSQAEVDELVRKRLEKQTKSHLTKLGVEKEEEIDGLLAKAKESDEVKTKAEALATENATLKEKISFSDNNIDPQRYEDVRIYFKGKGVELNDENLKKEIEGHKEWVNVTVIKQVGSDTPPPAENNEREIALNMFGVK